MNRIFYSGDLNIENGGMFYSLKNWQWGYVDAVQVTPCSDVGGPDNCFWVDRVTVNLREGDKLRDVLSTCGWTMDDLPKGAQRRHMLVDAHVAYGACDRDSRMVRIGAAQESRNGDRFEPDVKLRGNTSLRRFARIVLLGEL